MSQVLKGMQNDKSPGLDGFSLQNFINYSGKMSIIICSTHI